MPCISQLSTQVIKYDQSYGCPNQIFRTFEDNFQLFSYTLCILKTIKVVGLQRHFSCQPQKTLNTNARAKI